MPASRRPASPYLVLEYVEGETITRWCDTRRARRGGARAVVPRRARGRRRTLTRDSSCIATSSRRTFSVTTDGQVKLVDFGIAKLLDDESERRPWRRAHAVSRRQAFTPEYAAPEQVHGGEVTSATDVYALGVLLYVLLTGQHPTVGSAHAARPDARDRGYGTRASERCRPDAPG